MMSGTARIRKVVPAIHAALPMLQRSFLDTTTASVAVRLVWMTKDDWDTLRLALGHSLFPLRRPTEWTEKEIAKSHYMLDPTAVHGDEVIPFSDLSEEEFEELYAVDVGLLQYTNTSYGVSCNCFTAIGGFL